jgi:hypothetical protein
LPSNPDTGVTPVAVTSRDVTWRHAGEAAVAAAAFEGVRNVLFCTQDSQSSLAALFDSVGRFYETEIYGYNLVLVKFKFVIMT